MASMKKYLFRVDGVIGQHAVEAKNMREAIDIVICERPLNRVIRVRVKPERWLNGGYHSFEHNGQTFHVMEA